MLVSFFEPEAPLENPTLASVVSVMFGISEAESDVRVALQDGPSRFLSFLGTRDLALATADAICKLADDGHARFPVGPQEASELVCDYLTSIFGDASTARIGAQNVYSFQRFVYNVTAAVTAYYGAHDKRGVSRSVWIPTLRRAVELVAIVADTVKGWTSASTGGGSLWSSWHVLAYSLEMTTGTILVEGGRYVRYLPFLVVCDVISGHALKTRDVCSPRCIIDYRSSAFAWCACSEAWKYTMECCRSTPFSEHTTSAQTFLQVCEMLWTQPRDVSIDLPTRPSSPRASHGAREGGGVKRAYDSPPEPETRKATRRSPAQAGANLRRLAL